MVINRHGGHVLLKGEQGRAEFLWATEDAGIPSFHHHAVATPPGQARAAVDWLRRQAAAESPTMAVFARAGMMDLFNRRDINAFRKQITHLERGGRLAKLPPGPLSEGPAREFQTVYERIGDQNEP
jgi:hypothetical protein